MTTVVLLFSLGIVLLVLEVVLPGGIVGVIGGFAMLGGCAVAFSRFGVQGGGVATVVALAGLGLALYIEFSLLPKTRFGKKLFLHQTVDAKSQPSPADAAQIVGQAGETLTTLAPTGYVLVDGRRYEARSEAGLIVKGAAVRVVGVDSFHLIVAQT
jgi:membrane-bound ClpP family serine protease